MTRTEAIEWTKTHSLGMMRRSDAATAGVLDLWTAYMAAIPMVSSPAQAVRRAFAITYPPESRPVVNDCGKCGGTRHIRAFAHIHGGRCFACNP